MIIENIKILKADEGMRLTDGEIYAKTVLLPCGRNENEFTEITESEYVNIMKEQDNGTEIHQ